MKVNNFTENSIYLDTNFIYCFVRPIPEYNKRLDIIGNKHKIQPKARISKGLQHFTRKNYSTRLLSRIRTNHRVISNNVYYTKWQICGIENPKVLKTRLKQNQ